jgi:CRP-like cAMP-binding protein
VENHLALDPLERHELAELLSTCPRVRLAAGHVRDSDAFPETALLIVEQGLAALAAHAEGTRRTILSFCRERAVLAPPVGNQELAAVTDCTVALVPTAVYVRMLRFPTAARAVVEALRAQLRERDESLAQFGTVSHAERLRAKLLQLARSHGAVTDGGVRIELPLTHGLLAQAIGSARETVTTALQRLEAEGFLVREGRRYVLRAGDPAHNGRLRSVASR